MDKVLDNLLLLGALLGVLACFALPGGVIFLMIKFAPVWGPVVGDFVASHVWAKVLLVSYAVGGGIILVNMFAGWLFCLLREES